MTKIIETEDFLRLSLISYQDNSTNNTVPKLTITSHTCTLIRDLRDQFLRFETETEQVQSQQARPRLKRYSLNKRDRDSYSQIFETETETETRKMCIFETETRKMVKTETDTETFTDLSVASIYKRPVFKVRDRAGTVSTSETETKTEEIQSQQARLRLLFTNI